MLTIEVVPLNINMLWIEMPLGLVASTSYPLPTTPYHSPIRLLAMVALSLTFSATLLWLLFGAALCLLELFLPTAFTAFTMGLAAMMVALVSPVVSSPFLQVLLWLLFSTGLIFLTRRFLPKRKVSAIRDATEAQTITEILPGQTGRVLYEGNSWRARCNDDTKAIAPQEKVYVIGREGNTLIVMPNNL